MTTSPLLAVVGPTASGKSALAMRLARRLDGEIVSADSRQVYRYMNVGTAKPSASDRVDVRHHLIDVVSPDETYSLALFLAEARGAISAIRERGKLPLLVGGTAQYVWAVLEGWQVPVAAPDARLRRTLEERARAEGAQALHEELASVDPDRARSIEPCNVRRVIRALEVYSVAGKRSGPARVPPPYRTLIAGLALDRAELYARTDVRVDRMMEAGWLEEVRGLLARGYGPGLSSMSGVGYGELASHLEGRLALEDAVERTKRRTRRFARSQHAWFRRDDARINWHPATAAGFGGAEREALGWLEQTVC